MSRPSIHSFRSSAWSHWVRSVHCERVCVSFPLLARFARLILFARKFIFGTSARIWYGWIIYFIIIFNTISNRARVSSHRIDAALWAYFSANFIAPQKIIFPFHSVCVRLRCNRTAMCQLRLIHFADHWLCNEIISVSHRHRHYQFTRPIESLNPIRSSDSFVHCIASK